jgi:hypothetical protein
MPELSKLAEKTVNTTSAWDERKRLFDRLRDLTLNDEDRKKAIEAYKVADREFTAAKTDLLK